MASDVQCLEPQASEEAPGSSPRPQVPAEPQLCPQDPAVIQHRPSPQYATLDVYNPFETREVRFSEQGWQGGGGRACKPTLSGYRGLFCMQRILAPGERPVCHGLPNPSGDTRANDPV